MGFFTSNLKSSKQEAGVVNEWIYHQADNFRGCKRIKLSTYGFDPISDGINALKVKNPKYGSSDKESEYCFDIKGKSIVVRELSYGKDDKRCLTFFVRNHQVGTHFCEDGDELRNALYSGNIEKMYLKLGAINTFDGKKTTPQDAVYLFVKKRV